VKRMPHGRHVQDRSHLVREGRSAKAGLRRLLVPVVAVAAAGATLTTGLAGSAQASGSPTLKQLIAAANQLSNQIDVLSQQWDALKIQLTETRAEVKIAKETAARDLALLGTYEHAIGQIAAQGYMTGGVSPALQLLETNNPQRFLASASIMLQLQHENGGKLKLVMAARNAAVRAEQTAAQEERHARSLTATMQQKVQAIQVRENKLNSAAFSKATAIFEQTGHYPAQAVHGDSIGAQALRWALSRIGYPYVWGAAGPHAFDCSGLVVWSYAQIGISLEHFTGDLWNEGEHIPRTELQPGDLVFFYADLGHVGIYIGNGLMVDAPTFGQDVQVQPVFWSAYAGAVRIVA
jgi:peptidoglycan DL-endopeptidase CwlO